MSTAAVKEDVKALQPTHRTDKYIWGIYCVLCLVSIVELYSASSREVSAGSGVYMPLVRHLIHLFLGFLIVRGLQKTQLKTIYAWTPVLALVSAFMMVYVLVGGQVINGARRSFSLGFMSIFPAEFLKLSAVLMLAYVLCKCQRKNGVADWGLVVCVIIVAIFSGLLMTQGLTNTLLLVAISLAMMLIGGVSWKRLFLIGGVFLAIGGGYMLIQGVFSGKDDKKAKDVKEGTEQVEKKDRSETWTNRLDRFFGSDEKYKEPITSENSQEQYSYIAQANGGVLGVFPGNSRETARLPLAFSDYIFAIVVEDMGLIGGVVLIFFYLSLLGRASSLAWRCKRVYPALLIMGTATFVCLQALFHMAIVTGVFPVSGQPLPLISKGGTSIVVTSIAFGIMLSVSRHALRDDNLNATRENINDLPEALRAPNPINKNS